MRQLRADQSRGIIYQVVGVFLKNLAACGVDMTTTSFVIVGAISKALFRFRHDFKRKSPHGDPIQNFNGVIDKGEILLAVGRPRTAASSILLCTFCIW